MNMKDLMAMMAFVSLVFIPALALTARFAMKPIVESIVKLREAFNMPVSGRNDQQTHQIEQLQNEVFELRRAVDQLQSEREFDKQLHKQPAARQLPSANE